MPAVNSRFDQPTDHSLSITRTVGASPDLVFKAWTEPSRIIHWWGPRGFRTVSADMDLRLGGAWRVRSRPLDGAEHSEHGVLKEIANGERLVFTHVWDNSDGKVRPETIATVTFTGHAGNTELTFHQAGFASAASRDSHEEGWSSALELLTEYLKGLQTNEELPSDPA